LKPHTLFGDVNWQDYAIEGDVLLAGGDAEIGGRYAERNKLGFRWILTRDGRWQLNWQYTTLASGQIEQFKPSDWHHLRLEMIGDHITGFVDGKKLADVSSKSGSKAWLLLQAHTIEIYLIIFMWGLYQVNNSSDCHLAFLK
jgi:hypothetical protein